MRNEKQIKTDFIKWIKENHKVVTTESDLDVKEIYDNQSESNVLEVVRITDEGKEFFDIKDNGFEFMAFKEW